MKILRDAILFFTALILFFGSIAIIFFDGANLIHLAVFYIVVIPILYFLYHFVESRDTGSLPVKKNAATKKVKESLVTAEIDTTTAELKKINPPLLTIRSVFPLDIFPDQITIGKYAVTVVKRSFFKTGLNETLPVDQITAVDIVAGPIFASLIIKQGLVPSQELQNLWKLDAMRAKTLIEELMLKRRQKK